MDKVIVVEGRSDKLRIELILAEPIEIICTNGTASAVKIEELLTPFEDYEIFIFADSDPSGEKLRHACKREFPEARHLYTDEKYKEVATTPLKVLASILSKAHIDVKTEFIG
ncbi:MAG: toprim domain-containing protein [Paenisporosarcina sp.]